jgi:lysophospholipase L1-like esterase
MKVFPIKRTSFELAEQLLHTRLQESYDFVTLLVGVNNQYRGLAREEFATDFDFLLHKAIHVSGNKPNHVIVLSIPDWSATPFAAKKDPKKISEEINSYNVICESAAKKNKSQFINITEETRKAASDKSLLAADHLHYSGKEHAIWAEKLAGLIRANF